MSPTPQDSQRNGSPNGGPLSLDEPRPPRKRGFIVAWCIFALIAFVGFIALGNWQVERRVWKLDLIERAETRSQASPVALPDRSEWPQITARSHEYLHVKAAGRFLHQDVTFVQANTNLGPGFWALVPLRQADDTLIIVNRGFVAKKENYRPMPDGSVELTGLLRISEPGGGRLRKNEPENERWFSRDVEAIAKARHLSTERLAPYFIDVDYNPATGAEEPVGGLTIISFYNHHLVYALTWYTLALMVAGATAYLLREERKKHNS
ncbi:MAG: SURF1 family protein [Rhodocyclaceae bacterium]|nr:SURF1 family protein [Rhodocyclaceae bacterium]